MPNTNTRLPTTQVDNLKEWPCLGGEGEREKVTENNSDSSSPRNLRTYGRYVISAKNMRTEHEDSHTNAHGGTRWRVTEQTACTKRFRDHGGSHCFGTSQAKTLQT